MTALPVLAALQESNELLHDPLALQARWKSNGVLFFRGVIDSNAVARVRGQYLAALEEQGLVAKGADDPRWTGQEPAGPKLLKGLPDEVWQTLVTDPSFENLLGKVLGDRPAWVPIVEYRASVPSAAPADDPFAGRHQDGFYNEGIGFRICWVPLIDIDAAVGGLALAVGSHQAGYLHDLTQPPRFPIPADAIPDDAWRRADYHPGDIVIFHHMIAHTGLPNTSDNIRLSIDVRVLPSSARRPVVGAITSIDNLAVGIFDDNGREVRLGIDDDTFLRGVQGEKLSPNQVRAALPVGTRVIAAKDDKGRATVVRPAT